MSLLGGFWTRVTVRGHSMAPTFRDGQRLLVRRARPGTTCARGDVVVFALTGEQIHYLGSADIPYRVKRVAAVAGDRCPFWLRAALGAGPDATIPPGHIAVSGDNSWSQDSRHLGTIESSAILAILPARVTARR